MEKKTYMHAPKMEMPPMPHYEMPAMGHCGPQYYHGYSYGCGQRNSFAIIVVLFLLLIIVGTAYIEC